MPSWLASRRMYLVASLPSYSPQSQNLFSVAKMLVIRSADQLPIGRDPTQLSSEPPSCLWDYLAFTKERKNSSKMSLGLPFCPNIYRKGFCFLGKQFLPRRWGGRYTHRPCRDSQIRFRWVLNFSIAPLWCKGLLTISILITGVLFSILVMGKLFTQSHCNWHLTWNINTGFCVVVFPPLSKGI